MVHLFAQVKKNKRGEVATSDTQKSGAHVAVLLAAFSVRPLSCLNSIILRRLSLASVALRLHFTLGGPTIGRWEQQPPPPSWWWGSGAQNTFLISSICEMETGFHEMCV